MVMREGVLGDGIWESLYHAGFLSIVALIMAMKWRGFSSASIWVAEIVRERVSIVNFFSIKA